MSELITETNKCSECNGNPIEINGEAVCEKCGIVMDDVNIDTGDDANFYDKEKGDKRKHIGDPLSHRFHDMGLSTTIDNRNKDASGKFVDSLQATILRKTNKRHNEKRNLSIALQEIDHVSSILGIPKNLRETASMIYKATLAKGGVHGRQITHIIAAIIYITCRQYGLPRTMEEISDAVHMDRRELARTYRFLVRKLGINVPHIGPMEYLNRFATELYLTPEELESCTTVLDKIKKAGLLCGKCPIGIISAILYSQVKHLTQDDVCRTTRSTTVTLRSRLKDIKKCLGVKDDEVGR